MESLNSDRNFIHEDKETRKAKREERRQERREKRFEEKGDLKAFIQNLETLKSQIIANVVDTDHWIKQNPDSSVYPGYKKTFLDLLERVAKIMGDAIYISKKEGKKLETEDQELLTGLLETYNEIKTEYEGAAEKYSTASTQEVIADQKELKFKDISAKLIAAAKYFQEAAQENLKLLDTLKTGTAGSTTGSTAVTPVSDIKIEAPVKKGAGSKKSPDEKVKSVQKAILDKFKNNKDVTASQVWKNFAKYEPDGIFGNATAGIITALKAGFKMSDTTSDITQDFVNKLSEVKESLTESRVISFSDFMRIKEDFDIEAFNKAAKSSASGTTKKKEGEKKEGEKKEEGGKTPFECAKEAKGAKIVDIENGKTKVVIGKTSFYDNGRKKNPEGKMENYDCNDPLFKQEEVSPEGIEESLIKASEKIVELFGDASFWQPFKGSINDDEDAAAAEFDKWWKTSIERKYLNPATSKMENMGDSEDKQTLSDNIETLKGAKDKIRKKLKGDTDDDTFSWKIYKLDGETENYKIDTDF
jgi:hypothetical protein